MTSLSHIILLIYAVEFVFGVEKTAFDDAAVEAQKYDKYKLVVYTVATDRTDGFQRYQRSATVFNLKPNVLGMNEGWKGGDIRSFPGGGQKINLLRKALMQAKSLKFSSDDSSIDDVKDIHEGLLKINPFLRHNHLLDQEDEDDLSADLDFDHLIVLFTDSYDVILNGNASDIIKAFLSTKSGILFSSETYCWPDKTLAVLYPETKWKNKYLNSGAFIGFYKNVAELLKIPVHEEYQLDHFTVDAKTDLLDPEDDDQLYYTHSFLDINLRKKYDIKLDYENLIFINLNGIEPEELKVVSYAQATVDSSKNFASAVLDPIKQDEYTVFNTLHKNIPLVLHGNGDSKLQLNYFSNYVPLKMSSTESCLECKENTLNLRNKQLNEYPVVFLHIHVDKPTPFFRQFLLKILNLDYPKTKIILDIYSNLLFHDNMINGFLNENSAQYLATNWYRNIYTDEVSRRSDNTRDFILHKYHTNTYEPTYFFNVDCECHLDNPKTLLLLIEQNKPIVAPLLARPGKMWTNFWGSISPSGYYARSENYVDIVTYKSLGIFNVPFITSCYLIHRSKIESWYETLAVPIQTDGKEVEPAFPEPKEPNLYLKGDFHSVEEAAAAADLNEQQLLASNKNKNKRDISKAGSETGTMTAPTETDDASTNSTILPPSTGLRLAMYVAKRMDNDMAFCQNLRYNGDFMYVTNLQVYGHLIDCDNFETDHYNNDLFQIFDNPKDWEEAYLHPDWRKNLDPEFKLQEPCPDVYWFPIVTDRFCEELIEEMENNGEWSGGGHEDKRLAGGYENVPTDDIHMKQIGMERHWLYFLKMYVSPIQVKVYPGYHHDPPEAVMNFVVRYKPTVQAFLRPHHDSSTYTINLALNRHDIDYTGGGVKFIRYNCSVIETRKGWTFMHPGRLTHYHEGLLITGGTRYLLVSFVDP